tara:strand:- start:30 stop:524 length:495 start_codon:yes stop_codon:yes gene_type:complete
MKFNPKEFEEILDLEIVFSYSEVINLQMGYLTSGDYILYEKFDNAEIINADPEAGKYIYCNWGTLITIKKRHIEYYNKRNDDLSNEEDYFPETFDEIVEDFKEMSNDIYTRMNEKGIFDSMEHQLETYKEQIKPKGYISYSYQSQKFERFMQVRNISYIKEYFG